LPKAAAPKGFFARLPEAFIYPFRGSGFMLLIAGTFIYVLLQVGQLMITHGGLRGKVMGAIITIFLTGYLFSYMQSIIHTTAVEDNELPQLIGVSNFWEDILLPFLQLIGISVACFSPALLVLIAAAVVGQPVLAIAALPVFILGTLYFPMAFLAVVILDTIKAINPLIIFPSIFRVPLEYFVTVLLLGSVYGIRALGDFVIAWAFPDGFQEKSMTKLFLMLISWALWSFAGYYLLTASMRILGLLYVTKKDKLGWLGR
jgi:hypothetical protein